MKGGRLGRICHNPTCTSPFEIYRVIYNSWSFPKNRLKIFDNKSLVQFPFVDYFRKIRKPRNFTFFQGYAICSPSRQNLTKLPPDIWLVLKWLLGITMKSHLVTGHGNWRKLTFWKLNFGWVLLIKCVPHNSMFI